jgi:hypothetical protein
LPQEGFVRSFAENGIRTAVRASLALAVACSSSSNHDATPSRSTADASLPDVTFSMSGHVDGGGESFSCLYVTMPTDRGDIAVPGAESQFTPGSHHFLVYRTSYSVASIPDGGAAVHPCTDAEQISGIVGSYYEAQTPEASRSLPPGVAHVFRPGEVLLLTAHYLNPSATGLDTHVDFRMHTMPVHQVEHVAGSIFFYNVDITVPPMSDVTVTRTCPLSHDINLALLWSHMHSRGVSFLATTDDPVAAARAGNLYSTTTWSEPQPRAFPYDPPVTVHAGSSITYSCTYHNPTEQTFVQGQSALTNEMCILHGMYWPRQDSATELCLFGSSTEDAGP